MNNNSKKIDVKKNIAAKSFNKTDKTLNSGNVSSPKALHVFPISSLENFTSLEA